MDSPRTRPTLLFAAIALTAVAAVAAWQLWPNDAGPGLTTVSVHDLRAALDAGAFVIDVREPFEFEGGHVAGSVLVPLATVAARAGDFDKSAPIYVFCRSGNRSLAASQTLIDAGYRDVRNVDGGMIAWTAAGLPVAR
jgi:phage shock protein E